MTLVGPAIVHIPGRPIVAAIEQWTDFTASALFSEQEAIRDSFGTVLADGDAVTLVNKA